MPHDNIYDNECLYLSINLLAVGNPYIPMAEARGFTAHFGKFYPLYGRFCLLTKPATPFSINPIALDTAAARVIDSAKAVAA